MKQRVKLIPAGQEHLGAIAEIARLSFPDPWSEALFQQTLAHDSNQIWCAMAGDAVIGYLVLSRCGDAMNVDDIAVHPDYRRQGVARMLLEQAHENGRDSTFLLEVRESNAGAIALYQALGYVQVGYRKRYYTCPSEGAVLMTREKAIAS